MRSYELITKEEFLKKYSHYHNKYVEMSTEYGRRGLNIISEIKIKDNHEVVQILNELDQVFGLDYLYSNERVINCVVNE